jgi:hypothetical protein
MFVTKNIERDGGQVVKSAYGMYIMFVATNHNMIIPPAAQRSPAS